MRETNWQRRRDILICIICMGIIIWGAWLLVGEFFDAVFMLLVAMAIAFLISPAVDTLTRWRVPRLLATVMMYLVVLAALVGFFYALIFSLVNQFTVFTSTIELYVSNVPENYQSFIRFLREQVGVPDSNIQEAIRSLQLQVTNFAQDAAQNAVNVVTFVTSLLLNFLVVLVLSFYLTLDGKRIRDSIFSVLPQRMVPHGLLFEDALNRVVGNYIRGQLTLALIIGFATAIICMLTDLGEFALIFGVLAFLFETIPMVGPGLASISPILASLLLPDPFPRTFFVIGCFVALQAFESNVLGPRIVGHAIGLHPVASILALLVFAKLFGTMFGAFGGALGALVATPVVAAAWVVVASIYRSYRGETPDQIMARKRAPWSLRRPTIPSSLRFRSDSQKQDDQDPPVSGDLELHDVPDPVPIQNSKDSDDTPSDQISHASS